MVLVYDGLDWTRTSVEVKMFGKMFDRWRIWFQPFVGMNWWVWGGLFLGAAAIHFGTALLRLDSFWPYPASVDFSSYYAGAWALRYGMYSPTWSPELIVFLRDGKGLPTTPPVLHSTPLWSVLMLPFTLFNYPLASSLWTVMQFVIIVWCCHLLLSYAGCIGLKQNWLLLPIVVSFGPVFLNLTLGQNGPQLLLGALLFDRLISRKSSSRKMVSLGAWVIAVGAKIFPVLWLGVLLVQRRMRLLSRLVGVVLAAFLIVGILYPAISWVYWLDFLPGRTMGFARTGSVDDQSLISYLTRLSRPAGYAVPGLSVDGRHLVEWDFPWSLSAPLVRLLTVLALIVVGRFTLYPAWIRTTNGMSGGVTFPFVLFSLLVFPHMDRYNHILLLPSMVWLWGRDIKFRKYVVLAYFLAALSRLNHLWVIAFPDVLAALFTGFGLFAVLILLYASSRPSLRCD